MIAVTRVLTLFAMCGFASLGAALAQAEPRIAEAAPVDPDAFREGYESTRLSAGVLSGAILGAPPTMSAAQAEVVVANIAAAEAGETAPVCVQAMTRDGLFWSLNAFQGEADAALWRVAALTLRFQEQLSAYAVSDLLLLAGPPRGHAGACDGVLPGVTPIIFNAEGPLQISVNSQDRTTRAALTFADGRRVAGDCGPTPEPRLVADRACVFDVSAAALVQARALSIVFDNGPFGEERLEPVPFVLAAFEAGAAGSP